MLLQEGDKDTWLHLAPQLRHLHLSYPPVANSSSPQDLLLTDFLSTCIALASLELTLRSSSTLIHYLRPLPSRLVLLDTLLYQTIDEPDIEELRPALELPALRHLKRWRLTIEIDVDPFGGWDRQRY